MVAVMGQEMAMLGVIVRLGLDDPRVMLKLLACVFIVFQPAKLAPDELQPPD